LFVLLLSLFFIARKQNTNSSGPQHGRTGIIRAAQNPSPKKAASNNPPERSLLARTQEQLPPHKKYNI
jgi:hypothetical protein